MSPEFLAVWGAPCLSSGENAALEVREEPFAELGYISHRLDDNQMNAPNKTLLPMQVQSPRMFTCLCDKCFAPPVPPVGLLRSKQETTKEKKSCCDRTRLVRCPHDWG